VKSRGSFPNAIAPFRYTMVSRIATVGLLVPYGAPTQLSLSESGTNPVVDSANFAPSSEMKHWASVKVVLIHGVVHFRGAINGGTNERDRC